MDKRLYIWVLPVAVDVVGIFSPRLQIFAVLSADPEARNTLSIENVTDVIYLYYQGNLIIKIMSNYLEFANASMEEGKKMVSFTYKFCTRVHFSCLIFKLSLNGWETVWMFWKMGGNKKKNRSTPVWKKRDETGEDWWAGALNEVEWAFSRNKWMTATRCPRKMRETHPWKVGWLSHKILYLTSMVCHFYVIMF